MYQAYIALAAASAIAYAALRELIDGRPAYVNLAMRKADLDPILDRLRLAYAPLALKSPSQGTASIKSMLTKARG